MARAKAEKRAARHAPLRSKKSSKNEKTAKTVKAAKVTKLTLVPSTPELKLNARGKAAVAKQLADDAGEKKLSSRLLETLEKHRQKRAAQLAAARPKGRRGRRPKVSLDYVPEHQEEDAYVLEQEFESLQYDTGIPVPSKGEDGALTLDRSEDFDEELNFEW